MNWLDIVLIAILAWSAITAFRKGFTREIVGLASVVAALLAGAWFYGTAGGYFAPYLSSQALANLAGFFAIFAGVMILGAAVGFGMGKFLKVTGLSMVDHALGGAFGLIRGLLIAIAFILGIMAFTPGERPPASIVRSRVAPYVVDAANIVSSVTPYELKAGFRKRYAQVKTAWRAALDNGLGNAPRAKKDGNEREL